jgi:hypothetical protein
MNKPLVGIPVIHGREGKRKRGCGPVLIGSLLYLECRQARKPMEDLKLTTAAKILPYLSFSDFSSEYPTSVLYLTTYYETLCLSLCYFRNNLKVAGSSPDEILEFFNLRNPSSSTINLGFTHPLTEMSTRRFFLD